MDSSHNEFDDEMIQRYSEAKKKAQKDVNQKALVSIAVWVIAYAISWIITCGWIKLITMCFNLPFSWKVATGCWLIVCILKASFCNRKE